MPSECSAGIDVCTLRRGPAGADETTAGEAVVATGENHVNGVEDVAFITIYFPDKMIAHLNVNWLSPVKVRTTLIGGEKKMLVWNDLEADEKIKVYDKGVERSNGDGAYELRVSYRAGDMWAPMAKDLARDHTVVVPDLRGLGLNPGRRRGGRFRCAKDRTRRSRHSRHR